MLVLIEADRDLRLAQSDFPRQLQKLQRIVDPGRQPLQAIDHREQVGPLASQLAGALGVVPDFRDFQFALDLGQAVFLFRIVKDTPEGRSGGT